MPNRILKESICTSNNLNDLTPEEEIFFYRLIVNCDDYGRMDARPAILRARLFPLRIDSIKECHIIQWLQSLIKQDLLGVYEINGQRYLQVKTWENHQQIRAKRSKYPDSDGNLITIDSIGNQKKSSVIKCHRNPIQSESNPDPNLNPNKFFNTFWKAYPKKVAKLKARKAFEKINPDDTLLATMLVSIEKALKSKLWRDKDGQFIPNPATWLNDKRWEDEDTTFSKPLSDHARQVKEAIEHGSD